jgi:hypothetical protein
LSFFSKLQRLTNDSSPDSVPVGLPSILHGINLIILIGPVQGTDESV